MAVFDLNRTADYTENKTSKRLGCGIEVATLISIGWTVPDAIYIEYTTYIKHFMLLENKLGSVLEIVHLIRRSNWNGMLFL